VTSSGRSPFDSPWPLCYRLPIVTYPLAALVSETFDLKVADKPTLGVVGVAGGALSQGTEKNLGSSFPGIVISWKHLQLNNIIGAIFDT